MIPKQYQKLTFTILMGMTMAFFITIINFLINTLTTGVLVSNAIPTLFFLWIRSSLIAMPVSYFVVPWIQNIVNKIVKT